MKLIKENISWNVTFRYMSFEISYLIFFSLKTVLTTLLFYSDGFGSATKGPHSFILT